MSALLPLIKSHRAMADSLEVEWTQCADATASALLGSLVRAHRETAAKLEQQAKAETSAEEGTVFRSMKGEPRKVGGVRPARGMGSR